MNKAGYERLQIDSPKLSDFFRFVANDAGIQPSQMRHYSLPRDIVDIADGTDHDKMVDFLKLQTSMQQKEWHNTNKPGRKWKKQVLMAAHQKWHWIESRKVLQTSLSEKEHQIES